MRAIKDGTRLESLGSRRSICAVLAVLLILDARDFRIPNDGVADVLEVRPRRASPTCSLHGTHKRNLNYDLEVA